MIKCNKCNKDNKENSKYCAYCGNKLEIIEKDNYNSINDIPNKKSTDRIIYKDNCVVIKNVGKGFLERKGDLIIYKDYIQYKNQKENIEYRFNELIDLYKENGVLKIVDKHNKTNIFDFRIGSSNFKKIYNAIENNYSRYGNGSSRAERYREMLKNKPLHTNTNNTNNNSNNSGCIGPLIGLIILFIFGSRFISNLSNFSNNSGSRQATSSQVTYTKEEYKALCKSYSFEEISRNPNNYKGEKIKITGRVTSINGSFLDSNSIWINLIVKDWTDTVFLTYEYKNSNETRILEGDYITVYGTFKGVVDTYISTIGTIAQPKIEVEYWELVKK